MAHILHTYLGAPAMRSRNPFFLALSDPPIATWGPCYEVTELSQATRAETVASAWGPCYEVTEPMYDRSHRT